MAGHISSDVLSSYCFRRYFYELSPLKRATGGRANGCSDWPLTSPVKIGNIFCLEQ